MIKKALKGSLLGTAVGDSLGLPVEFLAPHRIKKIFGNTLKQNLLFGRGMVSDDTDHSCFVAMALFKYPDDSIKFQKYLAWRFRWWLMGLPAGIGFATLRSIIKLWLGFPANKSGVFSAGNGPAMRSSIIGVVFGDDPHKLKAYVKASTIISHTDPKAYHGAMAIAVAASMASKCSEVKPYDYLSKLAGALDEPFNPEFWVLLEKAVASASYNETLNEFLLDQNWKNGISGYILHTVAAVIQVWLRHQEDYKGAIEEIIFAGGDTDTTAAILGGIIGANVGKKGIPEQWLTRVCEWPRSISWMEKLCDDIEENLEKDRRCSYPGYAWYFLPVRNFIFLVIIFLHGLRRLLPPY